MPAVVLFIGRVLLVVALFIFLFCIMKTGDGSTGDPFLPNG